ncbi:MAG: ribosome maturation factor RimP [Acidimicrobiia bacterium]
MIASERIAELVAPVLSEAGQSLYDVEVAGSTVRVLVEGAGLGDLERVSPSVSAVLDEAIPDDERWYLEVSSPGLERPLRRPRHFLGAVGSLVKVKTKRSAEGDRRIEGVLEEADDEGVAVGGRRLRYDEIERARTVFEWGAVPGADEPGPRHQPRTKSPKSQSPRQTKRSTT